MSFKQKIGVVIAVIIALFGGVASNGVKLGAVSHGDECPYATTTGSFSAASSTKIRIGPGVLCAVNIGVTSATTFRLMDASSILDSASTTLLSLAASPVIGSSMNFDVTFTRGLFIEFPASFVGSYTIVYR